MEKIKPRKLDLYDIFCGVLYALKSGYQWRMLPKEFPKWSKKVKGNKKKYFGVHVKKNS